MRKNGNLGKFQIHCWNECLKFKKIFCKYSNKSNSYYFANLLRMLIESVYRHQIHKQTTLMTVLFMAFNTKKKKPIYTRTDILNKKKVAEKQIKDTYTYTNTITNYAILLVVFVLCSTSQYPIDCERYCNIPMLAVIIIYVSLILFLWWLIFIVLSMLAKSSIHIFLF